MPEELSPESKLYVKEEIEKSRKEIKEEVEKVNSKATKTFTTVAIVVGLITGLGVYGSATHYISTAIQDKLGAEAIAKFNNRIIEAQSLVEDVNNLVEDVNNLVADANNNAERAEELYNKIVSYENKAEEILLSKMIVGSIVPYGGKIDEKKPGELTKAGDGWFLCNGARLKQDDYPILFSAIGVAFGEPNDSTFNLPDLRGRFVRGVDHGAGCDPEAQGRTASNKGGNTGNKVGSYQLDNLQTHSHQWAEHTSVETDLYSWNKESKRVMALDRKSHNQIPGGSGKDDDYMDVDAVSLWTKLEPSVVNSKTETRPKNIYVNWIIKAQ